MKDNTTPATKADIQEILEKVDERADRRDERIGGLDCKLDDIDHQLRILVENTHRDLADASSDGDQILREHNERLEQRVTRLEEAVGLTAA